MWYNRIFFINILLLVLVIVSFGLIFCESLTGTLEPVTIKRPAIPVKLPKNPFAQSPHAYESVGKQSLFLKYALPTLRLPDLKKEIQYLGRNGRPDLQGKKNSLVQICLKGSAETQTVHPNEQIFLTYHSPRQIADHPQALWDGGDLSVRKSPQTPGYHFSPNNRPTSLFIEISPTLSNDSVECIVGMRDERGFRISEPQEFHRFELKADPLPRSGRVGKWEINGVRVDSTLLVRQKAKWVGQDLFLKMHGGSEYIDTIDKQRIDFPLADEGIYSLFVQENDHLIWKDGMWQSPNEKQDTTDYPLLIVTKIDEKMMLFELWDTEGNGKTQLSLLKTHINEQLPDLARELRFVGAKTWAQFMIETPDGRIVMRANDWFLLKDREWKKLTTTEAIDAYVDQLERGPLFVLDKMVKQEGKQMLIGHLFNTMRTEVHTIELPVAQVAAKEIALMSRREEEDEIISPSTRTPFAGTAENHTRKLAENLYRNATHFMDEEEEN